MKTEEMPRRTMFETETEASAALLEGEIVADQGAHVWPRFRVISPPAVGDAVSYAFNGDYTPDGTVVSVSKSLRVVKTSTGNVYYRRRKSAAWIRKGGTWGLVAGHVSRRNPSF